MAVTKHVTSCCTHCTYMCKTYIWHMRSSRDSLEHLKKMLYSHCQHFFETNQIAAAHGTYSRNVNMWHLQNTSGKHITAVCGMCKQVTYMFFNSTAHGYVTYLWY